jgi:5'(3')-deoxyribonucleotidase
MQKKIILCDVDGVLVDWFSQFPYFIKSKGLCVEESLRRYSAGEWVTLENSLGVTPEHAAELMEEFCTSEHIRYLTAMPDAIAVVNRLKHKYDFIGVTAISNHPDTIKYRMENLDFWFPGAFSKMHCVGCNASKLATLMKYDHTFWIDDSPHHVHEGVLAGHTSIRLVRDSREDQSSSFMTDSWYGIENYLTEFEG